MNIEAQKDSTNQNEFFFMENGNVSKSAIFPNDEFDKQEFDEEHGIERPFTNSEHSIQQDSQEDIIKEQVNDFQVKQGQKDAKDNQLKQTEVNSIQQDQPIALKQPQRSDRNFIPDLEECKNCNRKFFIGRLQLHQKNCTPQNPFKPKQVEQDSGKQNNAQTKKEARVRLKKNLRKEELPISQKEKQISELEVDTEPKQDNEKNSNVRLKQTYQSQDGSQDTRDELENEQIQEKKVLSSKNKSRKQMFEKTTDVKSIEKVPRWKMEHQQLVQSIRFSREMDKIEKSGGNVKEFQENAPKNPLELSYKVCTLQRIIEKISDTFLIDIAERHIPRCKNIFNRPQPPKSKSSEYNIEQKKKSTVKALEKYSQYVGSSINEINEEVEEVENESQFLHSQTVKASLTQDKALRNQNKQGTRMSQSQQQSTTNGQSVFLPKIQKSPQKYIPLLSRAAAQVQCPICQRFFEERAALRHIPICEKAKLIQPFFGKVDRKSSINKTDSKNENKKHDEGNSIEKSQEVPNDDQQFCTNCGSKFGNIHKYCGICGKKRY